MIMVILMMIILVFRLWYWIHLFNHINCLVQKHCVHVCNFLFHQSNSTIEKIDSNLKTTRDIIGGVLITFRLITWLLNQNATNFFSALIYDCQKKRTKIFFLLNVIFSSG